MPTTFTTPIPDAQDPTLDNGIEDEITASWADVSNYGDYRVQIRETEQSSWDSSATGFAEAVVGEAATSYTFTGLEDGEAYEVRLRTETEHTDGAWTSAVSIVTAFPTPTILSLTVDGATQVSVSWTDQADNEDGFRVHRRREFDAGWGRWRTVATVGPDTESATDDSAHPGRTYQYRVEAYTEDTTNYSGTAQATTDSIDATERRIAQQSVTVEIDHPNRDDPIRPDPLDDVEFQPTVLGLPRVRIPVRKDDRWLSSNFEDADMRAWDSGHRLPIDRLIDVEPGPDRYVLVGRGGQALLGRAQREVQQQEAHLTAKDLIQTETPYLAHVDDPGDAPTEDLLQAVNDEQEWLNALGGGIAETRPVDDGGVGSVRTFPSLDLVDSAFNDTGSSTSQVQGGQYNDGSAEWLAGSDTIGYYVDFDYALPAEHVGVQIRYEYPSEDYQNPGFEVSLAGSVIYQIPKETLVQDSGPHWTEISLSASDLPFDQWPDSFRELEISITDSTGEPIYFDGAAVYDTRYNYNFSENVVDGVAPGPELHPDAEDVVTELVNSAFGLAGARLASEWNDTTGQQQVAVRAGDETDWTTADNSSGVDVDWSNNKTAVQARFRLSRYSDGRNETPTEGNQGQSVDLFELFADVDDTPLLLNETFDGRLIDILNKIADRGEFIWELVWDESAGQMAVEWCKPGQRTTAETGDVSGYDASKSTAERVKNVIVRGGGQRVQAEEVTANHGTWVALDFSPMVQGQTVVQNATSGETYQQGQDYELKRLSGEIKTLSTGSIPDGEILEVDYDYKPVGDAPTADYNSSTDQSRVLDLPGLATAQACEQAALYLRHELSQPQWRVSVELSRGPGDPSLVESREYAAVPSGGPKHVVDATRTSSGTQLQLANRRQVSEAFADIQDRVDQISQRV